MAIKLTDISVSKADASASFERFDIATLNWDAVPDGLYSATMVTIYPWKDFVRDAEVRLDDGKGWYLKHEDGSFITELQKDVKFSTADLVFRIDGGDYDGYAVKGSLSTHPNWIRNTKEFLTRAELFDVTLDQLYKHTGKVSVGINTRKKTDKYIDKNTGLETSKTYSNVSWFSKAPKIDKTDDTNEDIGI